MPGVKSLQQQQYYAHPRNAFWPIMEQLFGIDSSANYHQRIRQLRKQPLILWDVLQHCQRQGSLDADIRSETLKANPIERMLRDYATLRLVAFNGASAEKYFVRLVKPLIAHADALTLLRLPSTSPAHASKSFEQKLLEWSVIGEFCN
jgi:double-stranded uracil-DNA glycosylase